MKSPNLIIQLLGTVRQMEGQTGDVLLGSAGDRAGVKSRPRYSKQENSCSLGYGEDPSAGAESSERHLSVLLT